MSSRKRITIALVGLIALVVVGWLVREQAGASERLPNEGAAVSSNCPHAGVDVARDLGAWTCVPPSPDL